MEKRKKRIPLTLIYWRDDQWFVGQLQEFPAVFSQGKNLDELVDNIHDAYELMVQESRDSIPVSDYKTKTLSFTF
jgi:predicted RNase H-like HicB family nuclease